MNIAYTSTSGRGDLDPLLTAFAHHLIAHGHTVCGAVQVNSETCGHGKCDMDIEVLPSNHVIRISQSLGTGSRGCRLDASGLETAVGLVEAGLQDGADLLIINKFGKQEAAGRGFRPVIADALMRNVPVLVGLNALNTDAFVEFVGEDVMVLPPDQADMEAWFQSALDSARAA